MTQSQMTVVLAQARAGATLRVSYDSPRGVRRFDIGVVAVKKDPQGRVARVRLERGSAAWSFIQRARDGTGELVWCFFFPNPCKLYEVELV